MKKKSTAISSLREVIKTARQQVLHAVDVVQVLPLNLAKVLTLQNRRTCRTHLVYE
jgi:hypothetical protein